MWYNWFWLEESVNRQNNFLRVIILSSSGTPTFSATWDLDSRRSGPHNATQETSTRGAGDLDSRAEDLDSWVRKYDICPNISFVKDPFSRDANGLCYVRQICDVFLLWGFQDEIMMRDRPVSLERHTDCSRAFEQSSSTYPWERYQPHNWHDHNML